MKKTLLAVVITFFLTAGICVSGFILYENFKAVPETDSLEANFSSKVKLIDNLIENKAIFDFDKEKAFENALSGYVSALDDEYAMYFDKDYFTEYQSEMKGEFTGIGASVSIPVSGYVEEEGLLILRIIGNSPAEAAGITAGSYIVAVNGEKISGMYYDDAVNMILGEENTDVTITVKDDDEVTVFTLTRKKFLQQDVEYRIIDGNIGYVTIYSFSTDTTYPQFVTAIGALTEQNVKGFIFDVRGNPGGEYGAIVNVLNTLVKKDELVVLKYKDHEDVEYSTGKTLTDLPSVVLINKNTASAAELFASALRDLNNSPLIGETSFGKGVGQNYQALYDGSGIKYTAFYYTTKSRNNYNKIGLKPDYEVILTEEQSRKLDLLDENTDPQLQKAIEVIKTLIK